MNVAQDSSVSGKALRVLALVVGASFVVMALFYWSNSNSVVRLSSMVYCLAFLVFALLPRKYLAVAAVRVLFRTVIVLALIAAIFDVAHMIRTSAYLSRCQVEASVGFFVVLLVVAVNALRTKWSRPAV